MSEEEEDVLPNDAHVWLQGTLLQDPSHCRFSDGNEVSYLLIACTTGLNSMMKVQCSARGDLSRYCQAKQFSHGDLLWIRGTVRKKKKDGETIAMVNVADMAGDLFSTWQESEA